MNVDKSIRALEYFCTDEFKNKSKIEKEGIIRVFLNISDKEKPISFRNKSDQELKDFILSLNENLKIKISKKFNMIVKNILSCSDNNKDESDVNFIDENQNKHLIELKFGSETTRNLGNCSLDKIFVIKNILTLNIEEDFFKKLNKKVTEIQRDLFYELVNEKIKDEIEAILIENLRFFLIDYISNFEIEKINDNLLNNTLNTTGSTNEPIIKEITKFKINYSENIQDSIKFVAANKIAGKWNIKNFNIAPNSSRLEIRLENKVSKVKFLFNSKNNWEEPKTNIKYAAKTGLKGVAWNVWIESI